MSASSFSGGRNGMRRLVALLTIVVGLAVTSGTASAGGGLLSGLLGGGCGVDGAGVPPVG